MTPAAYPSLEIRFTIEDADGGGPAVVDTGFDGHLVIPEMLVNALPRPLHLRRVRTASGHTVWVPAYPGTVELVDQPGRIDALIFAIGDEFLIGLATLNHFKVTFDHGHTLTVEP